MVIDSVPPILIGPAYLILGIVNLVFRKENGLISNYILLFCSSIFYNSFHETIIIKEFNRSEASVYMAVVSNIIGPITVLQILFRGELNLKHYKLNKYDLILLLFLIVIYFSAITGYDSRVSFLEFRRFISFVAFYIVTRTFLKNDFRLTAILNVFYASVVLVFAISIQKIVIGQQYGAVLDYMFFLSFVVYSKFSKNTLDDFLDKISKVFLIIGSLSLLIADSRRLLLSLVIIWFGVINLKRIAVASLIFSIVSTFIINSLNIDSLNLRYTKSFDMVAEISSESNSEYDINELSTGRIELWESGLKMILDNMLLGVGLDNHTSLMPNYGANTKIRIHNVILDIGAQLGLVGLALFTVLNFFLISDLVHLIRKSKRIPKMLENVLLLKAGLIGYIAVIVFSFFGGSMIMGRWGWFQIAFLICLLEINGRDYRRLTIKMKDDEL